MLLLDVNALSAITDALKKKPDSLEQTRRLEWLSETITAAVAERKKEALTPVGEPRAFRPTFALAQAAEKRGELAVDVIRITADPKGPFAKQLAGLFGPEWATIRVAVIERRLVVGMGSDPASFDRAIANVQANKPGLSDNALTADFRAFAAPARTAELHASAQAYLGFWVKEFNLPERLFKTPPQMTSMGIAIGKDELRIDLGITKAEMKAMMGTIFRQGE